jgi:hypothetical protein
MKRKNQLKIFHFKGHLLLCLTICRDRFYVQWFVMRDYWSFYWYWWNCWPSLFKLSLHKLLTDDVDIRSMPILNYIQHTQCTHLRLVIWMSCGFSIVVTPYSSYHQFKQWWSTIPPISIKWSIISHHKSLKIEKTMTYCNE